MVCYHAGSRVLSWLTWQDWLWQMEVAVSASTNHQHWVPVWHTGMLASPSVTRTGQERAMQRKGHFVCIFWHLQFTSSPPGYHNSRKKVLIWPFFKVILINFYADENKSGKFAFQYFYPIGILWGLDFLGSLDEINSGTNYYRIETKYQLSLMYIFLQFPVVRYFVLYWQFSELTKMNLQNLVFPA